MDKDNSSNKQIRKLHSIMKWTGVVELIIATLFWGFIVYVVLRNDELKSWSNIIVAGTSILLVILSFLELFENDSTKILFCIVEFIYIIFLICGMLILLFVPESCIKNFNSDLITILSLFASVIIMTIGFIKKEIKNNKKQ